MAKVVGRNTELIGLIISTAYLKYPNGENKDAIRESAKRTYALRNGDVVSGSTKSVCYLFCVGTTQSWQRTKTR